MSEIFRGTPKVSIDQKQLQFYEETFSEKLDVLYSVLTQSLSDLSQKQHEMLLDRTKYLKNQIAGDLAEGRVQELCEKYNWTIHAFNEVLGNQGNKKISPLKF